MKFQLEEKDLSFIEKVNAYLSEGQEIPLFCGEIDASYSIQFKVNDIAKANAFILYLMSSDKEKIEEINNILGIKVESIQYDKHLYLKEMRNLFLDNINRIDELLK